MFPSCIDSVNIELDPTSVDLQEGDVAVGISVTKSAVSECSLQSVLSIDDAPDVDRALEGIALLSSLMLLLWSCKCSDTV